MSDPRQTVGYLCNNPGDIDRVAQAWQGEIRSATQAQNETQRRQLAAGGRFCVFVSAGYGVRAMAKNLHAYWTVLGLDTVHGIVGEWAPPSENDTASYVAAVSAQTGFDPNQPLALDRRGVMQPLITALICHELGGNPYDRGEIDEGLTLAGFPA
jgi:hypothetical protein